jgi:hypothetical protein
VYYIIEDQFSISAERIFVLMFAFDPNRISEVVSMRLARATRPNMSQITKEMPCVCDTFKVKRPCILKIAYVTLACLFSPDYFR